MVNDNIRQAIVEALPEIVEMVKATQHELYGILVKKSLRPQDVARVIEIVEDAVSQSQQSVYDIVAHGKLNLVEALLYHLSCESVPCYGEFKKVVEYPPWVVLGISKQTYIEDYGFADEYEDYDENDDVKACGIDDQYCENDEEE